ncbi:MAG TPA: polysaccharide deacetylase family protein [Vicinamibacterales bacterium]|nr:polysaccharide deacetylase family protein [Vicinamibacterales bacterium]
MAAGLPILTFHSLDTSGSVISMPPVRLAGIVRELASAGWRGTTVSEALQVWKARGAAARTLGISFDDAYLNVVTEGLPVLADAGFSATVFVIAGRVGDDNRWQGQPASIPAMPLARWPDLERLVGAGWEIGSHALSHTSLNALSSAVAESELVEAKRLLSARLGVDVPLLAYPYGEAGDAVLAIARRLHDGACTARLALATDRDMAGRVELPRVDAYYLRRRSAPVLVGTRRGRAYLAARRWARTLRRRIR